MTKKMYHDQDLHEQHIAFLRARAQANFRKESWQLTIEDYFRLWSEDWYERGRARDSKVLARIDFEQGWTLDNVEITTRYEQLMRKFRLMGFSKASPNYVKRTYRPRNKNVQS
jgi:23S rRNA maturation mini-RNase III